MDSDAAVDSLIDTSDTSSMTSDQMDAARNGSISPDALAERQVVKIYKILSIFRIALSRSSV